MYSFLSVFVGISVAVLVCAYCWLRGGAAERGGVLLILAGWMGVSAVQLMTGQKLPTTGMLLADFLLGLGFLSLALKYNNLWLGAAMLLQGIELALNLYLSQETTADRNIHAMLINMISIAVLGVILLGAIATANQNRQRLKDDAASGHAPAPMT